MKRILTFLVVAFAVSLVPFVHDATAQTEFWKPIAGPYGSKVTSVVRNHRGTLYAGGAFEYLNPGVSARRRIGIYSSTAGSTSGWQTTYLDSSLAATNNELYVFLAPSGTLIAVGRAAAPQMILRSADTSRTWNKSILPSPATVNVPDAGVLSKLVMTVAGPPAFNPGLGKVDCAFDSGGLYLSYGASVVRSTDDGTSWSSIMTGLPTGTAPMTIASSGDTLYTSSTRGIYYSADRGGSWTILNNSLTAVWKFQFISKKEMLISAFSQGVMRSTDGGRTFVGSNAGMPGTNSWVYALEKSPCGTYFASTYSFDLDQLGFYASTDSGRTWVQKGQPLGMISSMTFDSTGAIYGGGWFFGVQKSTDGGMTWTQMAQGMDNQWNGLLYVNDVGRLTVGTGDGILCTSTDEGANWHTTMTVPFDGAWTAKNRAGTISLISSAKDTNGQFYQSTDKGVNWTLRSSGASVGKFLSKPYVLASNTILVLTGNGLLRSTDNGATWSPSLTGGSYSLFGSNARTGTAFCISYSPDFMNNTNLRSTDDGLTWQPVAQSINYLISNSRGDLITYDASTSGFKKSTDDGVTWASTSMTSAPLQMFFTATDQLYAMPSIGTGKIIVSRNNGTTWSNVPTSGILAGDSTRLNRGGGFQLPNGKMVIAAGTLGHIYLSSGTVNIPPLSYAAASVVCDSVSIGQNKDVPFSFTNHWIDTMHVSISASDAMFSVKQAHVVIAPGQTVIDTVRYTPSKPGIVNGSLVIRSSDTFIVHDSLAISGIGTGTADITAAKDVPQSYALYQNFPNPFNPSTTLRFDVAAKSFVSLTLFDMLGREVTMLVHKEMGPGSYTVSFDAGRLASGVYIYRLTAGKYVSTKKMLLVR